MSVDNPHWFRTQQISENIYQTYEEYYNEVARCNCWLIKGKTADVLIDAGLGVCDLRAHLTEQGLLSPPGDATRECSVIITHNHFDHSGGAKDFDNVYIHQEDREGLLLGKNIECLNFVQNSNFSEKPQDGFTACNYAVEPTRCQGLVDKQQIDLGDGEYLEIIHTPGHTRGSICIYYPQKQALFTGDVIYENMILDFLPTSNMNDYLKTADRLIRFLQGGSIKAVYPGHREIMTADRTSELLTEYIKSREGMFCRGLVHCCSCVTTCFFGLSCQKLLCPC